MSLPLMDTAADKPTGRVLITSISLALPKTYVAYCSRAVNVSRACWLKRNKFADCKFNASRAPAVAARCPTHRATAPRDGFGYAKPSTRTMLRDGRSQLLSAAPHGRHTMQTHLAPSISGACASTKLLDSRDAAPGRPASARSFSHTNTAQ